jgi:putative cardiolipin synthase
MALSLVTAFATLPENVWRRETFAYPVSVLVGEPPTPEEIAQGMGDWFDETIGILAFRVEPKRDESGSETLLWHGLVDGTPQTFDVDPYTGFWKRLGIGFLGILPIESQL